MESEPQTIKAASRARILWLGGSAIAVGAFIVVAVILPAEFGRDPTGIGRATGLSALWAPPTTNGEATAGGPSARRYPARFRSDVIMIELGTGGFTGLEQLEYKVAMKKGAALIYGWSITDAAGRKLVLSEFHGHAPDEVTETVAEYSKLTIASDNGALTAPFDGVHGWFFQNKSKEPVQIKLNLSGFYDLVDAGRPGNELGIPSRRIDLP